MEEERLLLDSSRSQSQASNTEDLQESATGRTHTFEEENHWLRERIKIYANDEKELQYKFKEQSI